LAAERLIAAERGAEKIAVKGVNAEIEVINPLISQW
jgi:hypothetical protein